MKQTTGHGKALNRLFRLDEIPTLLSSVGGSDCVTFAHIYWGFPEHGPTSRMPAEDAYAVQTLMRPAPAVRVAIDQRLRDIRSTDVGSLFLFNLHSPPTIYFHDPIDSVRFYIPASVLREAADEHGIGHFRPLLTPELGASDPIIHRLGAALVPGLAGEPVASRLFVDHMAAAVLSHLIRAYNKAGPIDIQHGGGLAPWQLRRAADFLLSHLGKNPSLVQVAAECALSRSQFARRFKLSTGCAPYQWLLERRLTAAKHLLRSSAKPVQMIAAECGFSSQSRFNKVFKQRMGVSPGAYRKDR